MSDLIDRAYGEDHLRDCMGYKSFGEWPCDCIIGDLCDEIERLRVALYHAHVGASDNPADYGVALDHDKGVALLKNGSHGEDQ